MKRLVELTHSESQKIRNRQIKGTMKVLYDESNYLCYDEEEYQNWKPRKSGRKVKMKGE